MAKDPVPEAKEKSDSARVRDSWTSDMREAVTHLIAIAIVAVTLMLLAVELWKPGDAEVGHAKDISSILGPWVGVVIGFYFGVRSGEKQAQAATVEVSAEKAKREAAGVAVAVAGDSVDELVEGREHLAKLEQREADIRREIARLRGSKSGEVSESGDVF